MRLTILHTNDLHGSLNASKAEFIHGLKEEARGPVLYCDTGDCIKAGNLAIPLRQDPAWDLLAQAGCDMGVIGNRESHVMESAFQKKIAGCRHLILCANMRRKDDTMPLAPNRRFELEGVQIGVFGVMVPMVTPKMATAPASAFLWDPPIPTAIREAKSLRDSVDCLIALTHIGYRQDQELAAQCTSLDIILGGHSHTFLEPPTQIGKVFICQGGSHGKFVGRYVWELGKGIVRSELIPLPT